MEQVPAECRGACEAELARYRHALELLDAAGGDPLRRSRTPRGRAGWRWPPRRRRTRCCRCSRRGPGCGCSSTPASARTGAASAGTAGFWLPECAYAPGLEWRLAEHGVRVVLRRPERPRGAARRAGADRDRGRPGGAADRLGGDPLALGARRLSLRPRATPSSPANRCAGCGSGGSAAAPTTRPRRRPRRSARRASSSPRSRPACASSPRPAAAAACSSSRSTPSCSATGGRRGRSGCARCWRAAAAAGVRLLTVPRGARRARARAAPAGRLELGRGQGLPHLGLAAGRRPRLGGAAAGAAAAAGALAAGCRRPAASAPPASCSPPRPATGPSSTSAARRATTPTSAPPITREALLRGHRLPIRHRSAHAFARPGSEPRPAPGALSTASHDDPRPDPLLGVPAADRGRPGPPRPQALRGAGRARRRGPRADPRRRGVPRRGASRRRLHPPHPRADAPDRPRRVRRLGRADELRHAGRRGRARRPLRLRPRPRPRLAGRQRLRPPRASASTRRW